MKRLLKLQLNRIPFVWIDNWVKQLLRRQEWDVLELVLYAWSPAIPWLVDTERSYFELKIDPLDREQHIIWRKTQIKKFIEETNLVVLLMLGLSFKLEYPLEVLASYPCSRRFSELDTELMRCPSLRFQRRTVHNWSFHEEASFLLIRAYSRINMSEGHRHNWCTICITACRKGNLWMLGLLQAFDCMPSYCQLVPSLLQSSSVEMTDACLRYYTNSKVCKKKACTNCRKLLLAMSRHYKGPDLGVQAIEASKRMQSRNWNLASLVQEATDSSMEMLLVLTQHCQLYTINLRKVEAKIPLCGLFGIDTRIRLISHCVHLLASKSHMLVIFKILMHFYQLPVKVSLCLSNNQRSFAESIASHLMFQQTKLNHILSCLPLPDVIKQLIGQYYSHISSDVRIIWA
jgi:hypothetical protein